MYFYEMKFDIKPSPIELHGSDLVWGLGSGCVGKLIGEADNRKDARDLLRKNHFEQDYITNVLNETFGKEEFDMIKKTDTYTIFKETDWYYAYINHPSGNIGFNDEICISKDLEKVMEKCDEFESNASHLSGAVATALVTILDNLSGNTDKEILYSCMGQIQYDTNEKFEEIKQELKKKTEESF